MFFDRYQPVIAGYARRIGLGHADADDLAQQSLVEFCTTYQSGAFDRRKGRLRNWLFGIVRNQIKSMRRRLARTSGQAGQLEADEIEAPEPIWDDHWRASILDRCLQMAARDFEPATIEAFRLFAILQCPAAAVAKDLGVSENAVYIAKRRVMRRIRELADQMEKDE